MEVKYSQKEYSYNFIHDSGVQTSIKLSPSGEFKDSLDRDKPVLTDKNKYTVIISSSKGCPMSCSFCHLTKINKPFESISCQQIVDDVMKSIRYVAALEYKPFTQRYIKLCYMGEGEPILDMEKTVSSTLGILTNVLQEELAVGVDGVDIATCMPKIPSRFIDDVATLNRVLSGMNIPLNPYNHTTPDRSIVRLFYSMHHYNQNKRDIIIPNSRNIEDTLDRLECLSRQGVNVVCHYMFMELVNDSSVDVVGLVNFINEREYFKDFEFRVLRYNGYDDKETRQERLQQILELLKDNLKVKKFKVQFSAGEDINAACGMFLQGNNT